MRDRWQQLFYKDLILKFFDKIFKKGSPDKIQIGDWVNSYSKGIFRIEQIVDQYYDESYPALEQNKLGDKMSKRIIISKRLLNSKYKKSISYESCNEEFVSPLSESQSLELEKVLAKSPEFLEELNEYEIPSRKTIYNMELQIDNKDDLKKISKLMDFIENGKTFIEIQNEMKRTDLFRLKTKPFGNYLFQLINFNDELRQKRKVWREAILQKKQK